MTRVVSVIYLFFIAIPAVGQYGNEWIKFDQPYFKIPVGSSGLYRLSYADLIQAGLSPSADPATFQLFHRGAEQSILVKGQVDGVFDAGDYIEFFGSGNDGTLDSTLYRSPADQPHRYYNLYSDTTSYFLTYGSAQGKRIVSISGSSEGLLPETHVMTEKMLILKGHYSGGIDHGDIQETTFNEGEGWMGALIVQNKEIAYVVTGITDVVQSAGKPVLEVLLTGRGPMVHHVELSSGTRLFAGFSFAGYQSYRHRQEIEWSDIDGEAKLTVRVRATGAGGSDLFSAGYVRLTYPQRVTMMGSQERAFLVAANADPSYLQIQDATSETRLFDVTDPGNVAQIEGIFSGSLDAVVPPSGERKLFATSIARTPAKIERVSFRNIDPRSADFVIVTHPLLRRAALGYSDPVKAYAEYRALPEGGGFDTLVVNIDQLYDQFNYGEYSPRAIFQFLKFFSSIRSPEYLFLIGKGLDVNFAYGRSPSDFNAFKDLVPTAGFPSSDLTFSAGLAGQPHVPAVATGRLTAMSPAEVAAYLNKVKERDALPFDDLARKKIIHISGGIEEHEPVMFRNILREYAPVAEGLYLGGMVQPIVKQSTDTKLVNIAEEVNNGLGLVTFFGHSAPNTTDFDIGRVTDPVMGYDNKGKYPFMLLNGCDAGSFFLNTAIFGEDWVKAAEKGAIGFIAHSSFGKLSGLQRYASIFYDVAFADSVFVRKSVGKVQLELAKRYFQAYGTSENSITQVQQMVLLGDPAVKLFGAEKPDYSVEDGEISISSLDGEPVTAYSDSFLITIPVRNFGIADERNVRLEIRRQFNDQPALIYDTIITGVLYSDTISFVIRQKDNHGFGINNFSVSIDADHFVDELSESNNDANLEYFIPLNSTRNLYPYNYSIVKNREVDLSFQYTDLQGAPREYLMEVDTTNTFDSGFKKQFRITTSVLGKQHVELLSADTVAYYWRTKIAQPLDTESAEWTVSSFTYINNGPEGWAQVHFPQFEGNATKGLVKDPELRRVHYQETITDIAIKTFSAAAGKPLDSVSVKINGVEFNLLDQGGACRNNTINLIAFDRKSTQPYPGLYFKWYELMYEYGGRKLLCGREPYVINSFKANELITGNQDDLSQYVANVSEGDSVVLFSIGDAAFSQWPEQAKQELASFGISTGQLGAIQDGDAVVVFGRKGSAPGSATVFHAPSPQTSLAVSKTIEGRFTTGSMSSVLIGPAERWDEFAVRYGEVEPTDDVRFSIVGVSADGAEDTIIADVKSDISLSSVDAGVYPHLRVIFQSADDINLTSAQLGKWLVIFEPVAEGLVFYRGSGDPVVMREGETFTADFGFVNVSDKDFGDSLSVRYDLLNHAHPRPSPAMVKIRPPSPGDTTLFTLPFSTVSREGLNDVEIFVNPKVVKEKTYDNNVIVLKDHLDVLTDRWSPVTDVTFDGRHLEDGEFIPASPVIAIRMWDENPYLLKRDTAGIDIFLAFPCDSEECAFHRINFTRNDVTWHPATASTDWIAYFSPLALPEGEYTLRVAARDAKGNASGNEPYQIRFRVLYSPTVTVTSPYPNPFRLETGFDVVITGDAVPDCVLDLEIFTPGGTVVQKFRRTESDLHIGRNTMRWGGTDRGGTRLPDGIYLYRLSVQGTMGEVVYFGKVVLLQ